MSFSVPAPVVVLGLVSGMTYGILAVGLVLIYRSSRIINFAHGEVGAFAAAALGLWVVQVGLPYWLMFPVAVLLAGATSVGVEVAVVRRLRNAPKVMSIVATLGASTFLLLLSLAISTQIRRGYAYPQPPGMPTIDVGALVITPSYFVMLVVTPVLVLALAVFLKRSRAGIAIRATADNLDASVMAGIPASRMSALAWGIAGAISAYTAVLQAPAQAVASGGSLGPGLLVRALAASVIARLTNLPTALAAGVGVGLLEQVLLWNYPSGGQVELVLFVVILGVLLFQTRQGTRDRDPGSWVSVHAWQPLPERLRRVWVIRHLGALGGVVGLGALVAVAATSNKAALVLTQILAFSLVGLSVYVTTGLGGQLSLGQFAFAGIGALVSYVLVSNGSGFFVGFFVAGLATAVASVAVGLPALRIRGLLLAVTTLSFAVTAESWLFKQSWAFGSGVDAGKPIIGSLVLQTSKQYYVFAIPFFLLGVWLTTNVRRGGLGRSLIALRDNEDAARAFGIRATRLKLQTIAFAGFLSGLGGALYAHGLSLVNFSTFDPQRSITIVAMCVIGGLSIVGGAVIGALYLIAIPAFLPLDAAGLAGTSLGWLLLILYFPGGLAQLAQPLRDRIVRLIARLAGVPSDGASSMDSEEEPERVTAMTRGALRDTAPPRAVDVGSGPLLDVSDLSKSFGGIDAVSGVSFTIQQGQTVGIIGPNGAGKTTLFELISGFTRGDQGVVRFNGSDVSALSPEARVERGLVRSFQDPRLYPTMTVLETVQLSLEHHDRSRFVVSMLSLPTASARERRQRERAREVVHAMGLDPYRDKRIDELSTGTRRITELACLFALQPRLLLLDEPSSGIAQRETEALGKVLVQLKDALDTTFVVIEHDIPLIMDISDRIIAMESGRIIADDRPAVVRRDRQVITSYLGGDVRTIERSGRRSTGGRCRARTRAGQPCTRRALQGGFCVQHARREAVAEQA